MSDDSIEAPGWPGIPPRWTSSAKSGVGTSLNRASRVWFTISHGIINEVYYPRVDMACTRDMGLIITDGREFFSEEKRHARTKTSCPVEGVPAYLIINECKQGRYIIKKEVISDPLRDVVLQRVRFTPKTGRLEDYHVYALLAPHLENHGSGNTAWLGEYKGVPMLFARRGSSVLALACSTGWLGRSAGFVGFSDGWQDLTVNKAMTKEYDRASDGNVALTAEAALTAGDGGFVIALSFGGNQAEAGNRALASLLDGFDAAKAEYVRQWQRWHASLLQIEDTGNATGRLCRTSATVLRTHEAKRFPGGIIASLSIPWGSSKGDDDLGGYHLVWPRDLAEVAGGLLAAGASEDVHRVLHYLHSTQEADGCWPQNMWLDGTAYWGGVQMDETAFPILLVELARREGIMGKEETDRLWHMVRRAAGYIARNGPVTQQDRWEEDPGYSPFTLAVEIAALLAASDMAELMGEPELAAYLRETADAWNESVERWTYVTGTDLARQVGVDGYYVRIAPPEVPDAASPAWGFVPIKNRPPGYTAVPATHMVSPDALALVRFGLRRPDDPRIMDTVKVIDELLKTDTPYGPAWRRYNGDGYGEHEDGSPFDGTGKGRPWPLITGERAHFELAAGRADEARLLMHTLERFANEGGMLSEQVWDAGDIPARGLYTGRPTGSAMPLAWAHAEYIKLVRSLKDGRVFDMPRQAELRYKDGSVVSDRYIWRFNQKCRALPAGKNLRIELMKKAQVHWSTDAWLTAHDDVTRDTGIGVYIVDLPVSGMAVDETVSFTIFWQDTGLWEGRDFDLRVT